MCSKTPYLISNYFCFWKKVSEKKRFGIRVDYPFCYLSCFTLNTMPTMNAENIEASCSAHHLPVMLPHQLVYASEDVVSLASATHGILFSIPLLLNSQLSNFLISSTAVCLLSVATNEYDLWAFQIPPQWPAKWKRSILEEESIFFFPFFGGEGWEGVKE